MGADPIPLDDRSPDWLAAFWARLPTKVQWPIANPDAVILARLKLDYSLGRFAADDPFRKGGPPIHIPPSVDREPEDYGG